MKLYSYIVVHDTGFAPNPFWGFCTLATCKPVIRRTASTGDWIVGLSPKEDGNRIIYAMRIDEILPYAQYFTDARFGNKKPNSRSDMVVFKCGDNIYEPLSPVGFHQLPSQHSRGSCENPSSKEHDLSGKNSLISKLFYYFGQKRIDLPDSLSIMKTGRAYKNRFTEETKTAFLDFIYRQKPGVHAPPTIWPSDDNSWKTDIR